MLWVEIEKFLAYCIEICIMLWNLEWFLANFVVKIGKKILNGPNQSYHATVFM